LLILPQEVVDRARSTAGKATTRLKLPVSLQIVLRAVIEEGLKRESARGVLARIETQARAVRDIRRAARRAGRNGERRAPAARTPTRKRSARPA
jgi:hypothetical protein